MKTIQKILAIVIMLASIFLKQSTVTAQTCLYSGGSPIRTELQSYPFLDFTNGGTNACSVAGSFNLVGIGANMTTPAYMLDILCDPTTSPTPTNLDVNISCPTCSPNTDAVGYRIGDSMMLWHNGIQSSLFVGSYAGGGGITPGGTKNTFVGNLAGRHNYILAGGEGNANTYLGYAAGYGEYLPMYPPGDTNVCVGVYCGYNLLTAGLNVFIGNHAGYSNTTADTNVFIGDRAGYTNSTGAGNDFMGCFAGYLNSSGKQDVFIGDRAGYNNNADWNTFVGNHAGFSNTSGNGNSFYGKHAGYNNISGFGNSFVGEHAGVGNQYGWANCAMGSKAMWSNTTGDSNVVIGYRADFYGGAGGVDHNVNIFIGNEAVPHFYTGDSNVFVGAFSDIPYSSGGVIEDAGAFGYGAVATANDKIIVGNNLQNVGIGMSGLDVGVGPTNRLEISYYSQATPSYTFAALPASTFTTTPGTGSPIGSSGLQFRDLTHASAPYPYDSSAYLTVDDKGNVVLMQQANGGAGNGLGTCAHPFSIPAGSGYDPTINLEQSPTDLHNFWIEGNSSTDYATNVYIGYKCKDYPSVPLAKLNVLEASGSTSTICGYFENQDAGTSCNDPVIGIASIVDGPNIHPGYTQVAGWFQAGKARTCCNEFGMQYAILVPRGGGVVSIGQPVTRNYVTCGGPYLLSVYGTTWCATGMWASDSILKTDVAKISSNNNALSVIQKLNGVSFKYADSVIRDSGMTGTHYGFIAQQVKRVLPSVVKTDNRGIEAVAYTEIIPWTVEAIKQEKQTNDSLRTTLDSLRSAFKNIQNCLNQLCNSGGDAPVHHTGGGGGSGDSNGTITNTQDIMLTAATNAPLLYQNIPNPFSTGTKINYYLPQGTQGATMVFYDNYGNQLKSVPLSQTGNGTLNITPDNLSAGIYSYSLVVNNNVIDTKRMLLQK